MHVGSTQYILVLYMDTETSACTCGVLSLYMHSVFYLQNHALYWTCFDGDVVIAQELLLLGTNVNYHRGTNVSDSPHMHPLVGACVGYQYTVY